MRDTMTQRFNLSLNDYRKFIVVDEGVDVTYGKHLIIAWLQRIRENKIERPIDVLLFSSPKYYLDKYLQSSGVTNFQIQDYFDINLESEEVDAYERLTNYVAEHSNSIFIIDCIGSLALQIGTTKACRFLEKLSNNHKSDVICIYRRDFHRVIPRIETLGNIYVKLKKSKNVGFGSNIYYEISVINKKVGGGIERWNELIQQNIETFTLRSETLRINPEVSLDDLKKMKVEAKPQATFRLEMNEREIKQRASVPLPYDFTSNPERSSKIFYVPDDLDYDDEDPDDDLDI